MWNVPPDQAQRALADLDEQAAAGKVMVWPEHWHAVRLFLRLATQWQRVLAGNRLVRIGLRYEAATPSLMAAVAHKVPTALRQPKHVLWDQLEVLEHAVLDAQDH